MGIFKEHIQTKIHRKDNFNRRDGDVLRKCK